jgi:uncharacterized protein
MRITVFGAAGNVGSRVVVEAVCRGHEVTAVVRNPGRFHELHAAAKARAGDAANVEDVVELSTGQDVGVRLLVVGGAATLTVPGAAGITVTEDPTFPLPGGTSRWQAPPSSRSAAPRSGWTGPT